MLFLKAIENAYKKQLFTRYDENGTVFYFSAEDFPGLIKKSFDFKNSKGETLRGYFYRYEDPIDNRLIVFEHGMGGGHRAYMKEIEMLARHGYTVYSYDKTGCMESEGESTNGFAASLSDLNCCISAIKAEKELSDFKISVVGHSWGAFAAMNICALHPDVTHIVAMSGFISVEAMLSQTFGAPMRAYRKHIYGIEADANPDYVGYSAVDSLKRTDSEVLIIHSSDDKIVNAHKHFFVLKKAIGAKNNIRFLLVKKKGHNPNYTTDAVSYLNGFFSLLKKKLKRGELNTEEQRKSFVSSFDWNRMTAQDESVWNEIFKTLAK